MTLRQVIASGITHPDSKIGVYAGDAQSYALFAPLLDPIIDAYHDGGLSAIQQQDLSTHDLDALRVDLDPQRVRSTRIRVARNLAHLPFTSVMNAQDRTAVEAAVVPILEGLPAPLAGTYHPLPALSDAQRAELVERHLLFRGNDKFLDAAGILRDWPQGRGIFLSEDEQFMVWINEEDHLRIIAMRKGADVAGVYRLLAEAIGRLGEQLKFAFDPQRGYLSSCPSNLGCSMRASVHVDLHELHDDPELEQLASARGLQLRGIHGEHTASEGGVYDVSNRRRLGITGREAVQTLVDGVEALIEACGRAG